MLLRNETVEEHRARMEAKAARLRHFRELELAAQAAAVRGTPYPPGAAPRRTPRSPKPVQVRRDPVARPISRPERCVNPECGAPLCSRHVRIEGAVVHGGDGLCLRCYDRKRHGGAYRKGDLLPETPERCQGECGMPFRALHQPPTEGTVVHRARGLCPRDYARARRAGAL